MVDIKELPIARSKVVRGLGFFLLFGALFFGFMSALSLQKSMVNGFPQMSPFLFGGIFAGFAILCLAATYFSVGYFEVYSDRIIVFSFIKTKIKTLFIDDLIKTEEILSKHGDGEVMTIRTAKSKFTIKRDDDEYDYEKIKETLLKGKNILGKSVQEANDLKKSSANSTNKFMLGFSVVSILFYLWLIYASLSAFIKPTSEVDGLSFQEIAGQVIARPETHKGSGRGDYSYVRFKLENFPKIIFQMEGPGYDATFRYELYHIAPNDSVFLKIPLKDYQKKIAGERAITFSDKTNASNVILVYEFRDNKYKYLTLEDYRTANISDGKFGFYLSFLIFGLLIYTIRKAYKLYRDIASSNQ